MTINRSALVSILLLATSTVVQGDDVELERAMRQVRLKVYQSFRLDRSEYDRRLEFLEQTLDRWSASSPTADDRQELLRWLDSLRDQPQLIGQTLPPRAAPIATSTMPSDPKHLVLPPASPTVLPSPSPTKTVPETRPLPRKAPHSSPREPLDSPSRSRSSTVRKKASPVPTVSTEVPDVVGSAKVPAVEPPLAGAASRRTPVSRAPNDPRRQKPSSVSEPTEDGGLPPPQVPSRRPIDAAPAKIVERSPRVQRRVGELPDVPAPDKIRTTVRNVDTTSTTSTPSSSQDETAVNVERLAGRIRSYHLNRAALAEELTQLPAESLEVLQRWTQQLQQLREEFQFVTLYFDAVPPHARQQIESPRPVHDLVRQLERRRRERWEAIRNPNERREDPGLAHELEALSGLANEYARWSHE